MRGGQVIVSAYPDPKRMVEGIIGAGITPKPGTVMQIDISEDLQGGRHVWELYNADADGARPKGPIILLTENLLLGWDYDRAYAAGDRAFGYLPHAGEEFNLRLADIAGTGDDHTKGEILIIDDTTGLFIATTGTPEEEVAMLKETVTDPTAETLAWCVWQR